MKTTIPFLGRHFDMEHTHFLPPHSSPSIAQHSINQSMPTRDRLDSFQSLSLSGPPPPPPSPFFRPLSQSRILPPLSSPPASPYRHRSPNSSASSISEYPQSTTPVNSHPPSMVSMPVTSLPSDHLPSSPGQSSHNVIDLTHSPSSSPAPLPPPSLPRPQPQPSPFPAAQPTTLENALPKTPVCIGRLDVTALIVYPSAYLDIPPSEPSSSEPVWGPVRLLYERTPHHTGSEDTISIRTPNKRGPHGEIHPGENFAVVEQKVASVLGPMLGKGLIRVESRIRRGNRHVRTIPLISLL